MCTGHALSQQNLRDSLERGERQIFPWRPTFMTCPSLPLFPFVRQSSVLTDAWAWLRSWWIRLPVPWLRISMLNMSHCTYARGEWLLVPCSTILTEPNFQRRKMFCHIFTTWDLCLNTRQPNVSIIDNVCTKGVFIVLCNLSLISVFHPVLHTSEVWSQLFFVLILCSALTSMSTFQFFS